MLERLIENYGLWAVFLGTLFEGETVLTLGGFAAHRDYLSLPEVMLVAFLGSITGDQLAFQAGRWRGAWLLASRPGWAPAVARARDLIERRGARLILGFRFLVGLRVVLPILWGMGRISTARFLVLNVVGAAVWSVAFGSLGYSFGAAAETLLDEVQHYERLLLLGITGTGILLWNVRALRRRSWVRASAIVGSSSGDG